MIFVVQL